MYEMYMSKPSTLVSRELPAKSGFLENYPFGALHRKTAGSQASNVRDVHVEALDPGFTRIARKI